MALDPRRLARREQAQGLEDWLGDQSLFIRELSALEAIQVVERFGAEQGAKAQLDALAWTVSLAVVDADGVALFADADAAKGLSLPLLNAILAEILRVNRLSPTAQEDAKKNLPTAPGGGSLNGSASLVGVST